MDPPKFDAWLHAVHSDAHIGLISNRLWLTQRSTFPATFPPWDDGQLSTCVRDVPLAEAHARCSFLNRSFNCTWF
jgi:hypothetical protein